jgi:hypothetical protein
MLCRIRLPSQPGTRHNAYAGLPWARPDFITPQPGHADARGHRLNLAHVIMPEMAPYRQGRLSSEHCCGMLLHARAGGPWHILNCHGGLLRRASCLQAQLRHAVAGGRLCNLANMIMPTLACFRQGQLLHSTAVAC